MSLNGAEYFDITKKNLSELSIDVVDHFKCVLKDEAGNEFKGVILARSGKGEVITLCDLHFQKSSTDGKYQPRLIFRKCDAEFEEKTTRKDASAIIISFSNGQEGYREFWKMVAFLYKFKDKVDLGEFEKTYGITDRSAYYLEFKKKEDADRVKELSEFFKEANVTEEMIKQAQDDTRKNILKEFRKLLEEENYWKDYERINESELKGSGEEAVWHHFLKKNTWILGLNVDLRFIRDLIDEANVGTENTTGAGSPEVDFLGMSDYTVLIELKTPSTKIFTEARRASSRANTWSFSTDFIDGASQCLGQKFKWDSDHDGKDLIDSDGNIVNQNLVRTVDPKTIFIIGSSFREIPNDSSSVDIVKKRDTFERFRRNNRNLDIITYDELYYRAYFIVHNEKADALTISDPVIDQAEAEEQEVQALPEEW